MNKKLVKHAVSFLMLLVLFTPVFVFAQIVEDYFKDVAPGQLNLPSQEAEVTVIITNIINVVLGFLGLIAVIIILIGGFKWMTASGSADRVADAKRTISYGLIGLAIIILAYAIVRVIISFVIDIGKGTA